MNNLWTILMLFYATALFPFSGKPPRNQELKQSSTQIEVEVRVPLPPTPVKSENGTLLVYELHISNLTSKNITLAKAEIFNSTVNSNPIASYESSDLQNALMLVPRRSEPGRNIVIGSGVRAILFVWLTIKDTESVPIQLAHRLSLFRGESSEKQNEVTLECARIAVSKTPPLIISPPLRGGNWLAANGPNNGTHHRRATMAGDGCACISQRFAIDWAQLGDDGELAHGDASKLENWYGYGEEVLAVADGVVTQVKDGMPDTPPGKQPPGGSLTAEETIGNYVALAIGTQQYALYAHLKPQSVRVKVGERVRRGTVLGLLGNSGNSNGPHLHFHVSNADSKSPFASEGLPFVFPAFEKLAVTKKTSTDSSNQKYFSDQPKKLTKVIPLANDILRFQR